MLRPESNMDIPKQTQKVAKAAFPKGSLLLTIRDGLGLVFKDELFCKLYPTLGQPTLSPARLALVTILQFMENLSDRRAAEAVRSRIDWKYFLGLNLDDAGFHYSVLSEFRSRLLKDEMESRLFERLLDHFDVQGLLKKKDNNELTQPIY